jgi:hypothetical protein
VVQEMSTDYSAVCDACREGIHIGQRFSSGWAFGYGTNDAPGRLAAGKFIQGHVHNAFGLRVVRTDDVPSGYRFEDED